MKHFHTPLGSAGVADCTAYPDISWRFFGEHVKTFSDAASGFSGLVTAVTVIVGGIWAYRKFIKGRTFKPRLSAELSAQWHHLPAVGHVLRVRVGVTNIGASKLVFTPRRAGLKISFPAAEQTSTAHRRTDEWWADIRWDPVPKLEGGAQARTFAILENHAWIEPGEKLADDLLLNLGREPTIARIEAEMFWWLPRWWGKNREIKFVQRPDHSTGSGYRRY
jgi:hypothetical protein